MSKTCTPRCTTAGEGWDADAGACVACPNGEEAVNGLCVPCAAGSYESAGVCENCAPGTFSVAGATACTPCPAGTYQPSANAAECIACQGTPSADKTACPCTGPYYDDLDLGACVICPAFSSLGTSDGCLCDAGFEPATASERVRSGDECRMCLAGTTSVPGSDPPGCVPCADRLHAPVDGMPACEPCAPGFEPTADKEACVESSFVPDFYTTGTATLVSNNKVLLLNAPLSLTVGTPVTIDWILTPTHPLVLSTSDTSYTQPGADKLTQVVDRARFTTTVTLLATDITLYYTCRDHANFEGVFVTVEDSAGAPAPPPDPAPAPSSEETPDPAPAPPSEETPDPAPAPPSEETPDPAPDPAPAPSSTYRRLLSAPTASYAKYEGDGSWGIQRRFACLDNQYFESNGQVPCDTPDWLELDIAKKDEEGAYYLTDNLPAGYQSPWLKTEAGSDKASCEQLCLDDTECTGFQWREIQGSLGFTNTNLYASQLFPDPAVVPCSENAAASCCVTLRQTGCPFCSSNTGSDVDCGLLEDGDGGYGWGMNARVIGVQGALCEIIEEFETSGDFTITGNRLEVEGEPGRYWDNPDACTSGCSQYLALEDGGQSTLPQSFVGSLWERYSISKAVRAQLEAQRGCDGVVNSGKVFDACGVCGGNNDCIPRLRVQVYLPTEAELADLALDAASLAASSAGASPLRGRNTDSWERLHVTAQMRARSNRMDGCRYRLRPSGDLTFDGYAAREMGCTLTLADGAGSCALELPTSLSDTGVLGGKMWVGAEVDSSGRPASECEWPDRDEDALLIVLAPFTLLRECEADFFWSETKQECEACTDEVMAASCALGQHIAGCDILSKTPTCEDCPVPLAIMDSGGMDADLYQWVSGEVCELECKNTDLAGTSIFQKSNGVCERCNVGSLTCDIGYQLAACTKDRDAHCEPCPPIPRGFYTDNEEFYIAGDCSVTRCKAGFFRDADTSACLPCTSTNDTLLELEPRTPGVFYYITECSQSADRQARQCVKTADDVADSFKFTGDSETDLNECAFECQPGFYDSSATTASRCWPCDLPVLIDGGGETDFYEWTGPGCAFACRNNSSPAYHDWNNLAEGIVPAGSQVCLKERATACPIEQYPYRTDGGILCEWCSPANTDLDAVNKKIVGVGSLDDPGSCPVACKPNFYDDFGTCRPTTAATLTCPENHFKRNATSTSDAICQECSTCEGSRTHTDCAPDADTVCEPCPAVRANAHSVDPECMEKCLPDFTQLWPADGSPWVCEDCSASKPCAPGTQTPAQPTACGECVACPTPPLNANFTTGCLWRCPSGYTLSEQDGASACVKPDVALPDALLPTLVPAPPPPLQCPPGEKLVREADGLTCTPCVERTPLITNPPTWQWRITPCDQPNAQGWECVAGLVPYEEFAVQTLGIDAPLPECLTYAERKQRVGEGLQAVQSLKFSQNLPRMHSEPGLHPAAIIVIAVLGGVGLFFMVCLACQQRAPMQAIAV